MSRRSRSKEFLEFEIAFYERLLADHPDFTDALLALGEAYTRQGCFEQGLAVDQKLAQLKAHDPVVWYNLACSYALLERHEEALDALQKALDLGYDDVEYLLNDPDLASLHRSPQLRRLLAQRVFPKTS